MSISDRGSDHEAKFAHDEEIRFRVEARGARLVGLWAADKLGHIGAAAEDYAASLVRADLGAGGSQDVFARIRADFDAAGVPQSDHQIRRHMEESLAAAKLQVMGA